MEQGKSAGEQLELEPFSGAVSGRCFRASPPALPYVCRSSERLEVRHDSKTVGCS